METKASVEARLAALEACADLLEQIEQDRGLLAIADVPLRERLLRAAGLISVPSHRDLRRLRKEEARLRKQAKRVADKAALERTGLRKARTASVFATPSADAPRELAAPEGAARLVDPTGEGAPEKLSRPRGCYVCKQSYTDIHHFYDSMCTECGDFNWEKRTQTYDLTGRFALVTGSRVKIGYQAAIKLLRSGCSVIVTTRFPSDAAQRYAAGCPVCGAMPCTC